MKLSLSLRIVIRTLANIGLVYAMNAIIPVYFQVIGSWAAFILIGILLGFLNVLVRPILDLVTLPLKLFATLLAVIIVNGVILWLTYRITLLMDPNIVMLVIGGGIGGWVIASIVLGTGNWILKHLVH